MIRRRPLSRRVLSMLALTLTSTLALLDIGIGPARADATVRLTSANATARQGTPFTFTARAVNDSAEAMTVSATFDVKGVNEPAEPIRFFLWTVSIPAGQTATKKIEVNPAVWFPHRGEYRIRTTIEGQPTGNELRFEVTAPPIQTPRFRDVTEKVGLVSTRPDYVCGHWAAGAAWGDVDGDGDLDLFVPDADGPPEMWINSAGNFRDEAATRGLTGTEGLVEMGAVFADYDNDGDDDLYVSGDGPNKLYQNDGRGRFVDVASDAGVADQSDSASASWGDYDNDGLLDLYVANYASCITDHKFTYHFDKLYHNEGDGTFSDQSDLLEARTGEADDGSTIGAGFQAAWFDYDGDGDQDLYLANDYHGHNPDQNHLWRNDGLGSNDTWKFTEVSVPSGTAFRMFTMGIALGDYDRDLDMDMALSNITAMKLMRNDGDGTFTDVAGQAGIARVDQTVTSKAITWGVELRDFNLDGWEDLLAIGGSLKTSPDPQLDQLYVATGGGRFVDLSAPSGMADPGIGRGVAIADYDRDGRLDAFVVNQAGRPKLMRNVTRRRGRHWLEVDTIGRVSNRTGCGTRVILTVGGGRMMRDVFCGSTSLSSGSDSTLHFGLGAANTVRKMVVRWPSGARQVLRDIEVDRLMTLREPR